MKSRLAGVATCVVFWCTLGAFVWAQSVPPHFKVVVGHADGSGGMTQIEVLSLVDERPDLLEVTLPDGSRFRRYVDEESWKTTTWKHDYQDREGWAHGRVTIAGAGPRGFSYDLKYRILEGGTVEYLLGESGAIQTLHAVTQLAPGLMDGATDPQSTVVVVTVVLMVIFVITMGCAWANRLVLSECGTLAGTVCGPGNVDSVSFDGTCGVGECTIVCD